MGRTIAEIKAAIVAAKEDQLSLLGLTSSSGTAIWNLWADIQATAIWLHEGLWDVFKAEITAIANSYKAGTAAWYQQQVLLFQYGDDLVIVDYIPTYDPVDPDARIVTRCAVVEGADGLVTIKVAKGEDPEPLSGPEVTALESYIDDFKFAGTLTHVLTKNADLLILTAEVFYEGELILTEVQTAVEAAITDYMKNIQFNGILVLSEVVDAVKAVPGMHDLQIDTAYGIIDGGSPVLIDRIWQTSAGYIKVDPDNPLADTLTYTPSNV